ncbi:hypothetical protein [uncultured Tolumonas sp.]|uniref:hypothetical protein n=1 Tax=uncultured Tolumonas sp. TaxID=263765 RepID=UPI002A0A1E6C|nr:hypothetical protein [uncultured Tolumonas sp.]
MSMRYSVDVKNARAQATANKIDVGAGAGSLTIYSGELPVTLGNITTQTAILTLPLQKPCAAIIENGVTTLAAIAEQMVMVTGTATWALIKNGDGIPVVDLLVGVNGSGADIELPTTDLIQGAFIRVTAGQISEA